MSVRKSDPVVKIYVSCHKPTSFIKSGVFVPIQLNAKNAKFRLDGMKRDDEGKENISELNPRLCELTSQYWAWKNDDGADYYGFFHYRRYLSFNVDKRFPVDEWGSVVEGCLCEASESKYNLDDEDITALVKKYDIVLPQKRNILSMPGGGKNLREQYLGSGFLHECDLDIMLKVLEEKCPEYLSYAKKYLSGHKTYLNNMFIMRKDIFQQYSEWLFDILLECNKRIKYDDYSVEAIRTPGHLAERLLNIYIAKLIDDDPGLKIKELQTVVFLNTEPVPELKPAFKKQNVALALSANDYYAPYLATLIKSIKDNSSDRYNYDLIIMHKDICERSQRGITDVLNGCNNFSVRFVNVSSFSDRFGELFLRGHFTIETWFRLLMPEIFLNYDKILYLDSDMVVNADVAELYMTKIDGLLLAACYDADTAGLYNGYDKNKKKYMNEALKLDSPYDYFQAGVILFNLSEFRETYSVKYMLELAASRKWELLDQDVLNVLAKNKVKYLDMSWNVMFDWNYIRRKDIISMAPKYLSDAYDLAHSNPKIIHYAGPDKPWHDPLADYADLFWKYARETSFYEEIMRRMAVASINNRPPVSVKRLLRKYVIDKAFPYDTKRRSSAVKLYRKIRH